MSADHDDNASSDDLPAPKPIAESPAGGVEQSRRLFDLDPANRSEEFDTGVAERSLRNQRWLAATGVAPQQDSIHQARQPHAEPSYRRLRASKQDEVNDTGSAKQMAVDALAEVFDEQYWEEDSRSPLRNLQGGRGVQTTTTTTTSTTPDPDAIKPPNCTAIKLDPNYTLPLPDECRNRTQEALDERVAAEQRREEILKTLLDRANEFAIAGSESQQNLIIYMRFINITAQDFRLVVAPRVSANPMVRDPETGTAMSPAPSRVTDQEVTTTTTTIPNFHPTIREGAADVGMVVGIIIGIVFGCTILVILFSFIRHFQHMGSAEAAKEREKLEEKFPDHYPKQKIQVPVIPLTEDGFPEESIFDHSHLEYDGGDYHLDNSTGHSEEGEEEQPVEDHPEEGDEELFWDAAERAVAEGQQAWTSVDPNAPPRDEYGNIIPTEGYENDEDAFGDAIDLVDEAFEMVTNLTGSSPRKSTPRDSQMSSPRKSTPRRSPRDDDDDDDY
eukprot:gnl/TRDRNA2_/TRDRNA2_91424_c0_seq1.p1 gnl/TRDRNA2_/TRDRNA2_91424_c0~~gnl/TRDRNA2_/TRDRNA2_91424_c0_seq1.p1  ORF type:complete len:545 (-),score=97.02 gnl/TRDRNA2_/TRDRNA2_91424_c0_seq1:33-1535(-)